MVLWDAQSCEGHARIADRVLRLLDRKPLIAERVGSIELMRMLVGAGVALALTGASYARESREVGIEYRPVAGRVPLVITYLLHLDGEPRRSISRFATRAGAVGPIGLPNGAGHDLERSGVRQ